MIIPVVWFIAGAVAMIVIQRFAPTGWWLNSSEGVRLTVLALVALAATVAGAAGALAGANRPRQEMARTFAVPMAALWCGVMVGQTAVLFVVGPETIFPIVLAIGGVISGAAILVGGTAGLGVSLLRRGLTR